MVGIHRGEAGLLNGYRLGFGNDAVAAGIHIADILGGGRRGGESREGYGKEVFEAGHEWSPSDRAAVRR
jgi:hypothetical protein